MTMLKKLMGIHFIVTLIIAGICVNLVQAALFIALRPLWKNAFRRVSRTWNGAHLSSRGL